MSIRAAITDHLWNLAREGTPGDLLPTINELCAQFGTKSTQNVRNAYAPLIEAGYVGTIESPQRRMQLLAVPPAAGMSVPELIAHLEETLADAQAQLNRLRTALNASPHPRAATWQHDDEQHRARPINTDFTIPCRPLRPSND